MTTSMGPGASKAVVWAASVRPRQDGKFALVTGANAGLGFFISAQLAHAGARVILACRNSQRADAAASAIRSRIPGADVTTMIVDTSDIQSVQNAGDRLGELPRLDVLIANAGIVHTPRRRQVSVDGNELVLATNHLGHFALIAHAMPVLSRTPGSRVVSMGSIISRLMDSKLDNLQLERGYNAVRAYAQSKIAVQSFGFELDRRLRAAGLDVRSLVVHPGYSTGGLTPRVAGVNEPSTAKRFIDNLQGLAGAQGKDHGAWSAVRAATDPEADGGQYWGPEFLVRGRPVLQAPTRTSLDLDVADHLWAASERYAATPFPL